MAKKKTYKPIDPRQANIESRLILIENDLHAAFAQVKNHPVFREPQATLSSEAREAFLAGEDMTIFHPELPSYELARFEKVLGRCRRIRQAMNRLEASASKKVA